MGFILALAGCIVIYLMSPHQRWMNQRLAARFFLGIGAGLLIISLYFLITVMQTAAAVFTWFSWIMLLLLVFPYLGALSTLKSKSS